MSQILSVTCDIASLNDMMIDALAEELSAFPRVQIEQDASHIY